MDAAGDSPILAGFCPLFILPAKVRTTPVRSRSIFVPSSVLLEFKGYTTRVPAQNHLLNTHFR